MTSVTRPRGLLPESWRVRLPIFEGPLDLLLHLVKVNEVEIVDIPVAVICDQFHEYLSLMEELDLDIAGEYVYEAAMLIQLKSRLLLPSADPESAEEEVRRDLVDRLIEYRRLKEAAQSLAEIHQIRQGVWPRPPVELEALADDQEPTLDLSELSLYDLLRSLHQVLERYDREHPPPWHVDRESFSVREQLLRLLDAVPSGGGLDLLADLRERSCRAEVVAAFLAVLELLRLRLARVHQTAGGSLWMHRTDRKVQHDELEAISS